MYGIFTNDKGDMKDQRRREENETEKLFFTGKKSKWN